MLLAPPCRVVACAPAQRLWVGFSPTAAPHLSSPSSSPSSASARPRGYEPSRCCAAQFFFFLKLFPSPGIPSSSFLRRFCAAAIPTFFLGAPGRFFDCPHNNNNLARSKYFDQPNQQPTLFQSINLNNNSQIQRFACSFRQFDRLSSFPSIRFVKSSDLPEHFPQFCDQFCDSLYDCFLTTPKPRSRWLTSLSLSPCRRS